MKGDYVLKVNDKKTPTPHKGPDKKSGKYVPSRPTPTRDSGFGRFERNPQQDPKPKPVKK